MVGSACGKVFSAMNWSSGSSEFPNTVCCGMRHLVAGCVVPTSGRIVAPSSKDGSLAPEGDVGNRTPSDPLSHGSTCVCVTKF